MNLCCCRAIPFGGWEMFWMRALFALVLYDSYTSLPAQIAGLQGQPDPVGLARLFDLTFLADAAALETGRWMMIAALVLYSTGWGLAVALPVICFWLILPATLSVSQGGMTHHLQMPSLVLSVQAAYVLGRVVLRRRGERLEMHRNLIHYARQTVVATYLVTGITKMWSSNGGWIRRAKFFPVQLEKTRQSEYYNRLGEKKPTVVDSIWEGAATAMDDWFAACSLKIEALFLESPQICRFFLALGLLLEFLAPLAMLGRRSGVIMGCLLVMFHLTISRIMNLTFEQNIFILLIFFVNIPWLLYCGARRVKDR